MISITQRLLNSGRGAVRSSHVLSKQFSASSSLNQSLDFEFEDESTPPVPQQRQPREKFVNKISLYGTCGKKPEEFGTEGREVTIFPLLTKNFYGPYGNLTEEKHWHKIMITNSHRGMRQWALENLNPGDKVMVTGAIYYKNVDESNADAGRMTTIVAETTILAEKKNVVDRD